MEKSLKNTDSFLKNVMELIPHDTKNSLRLNGARNIIPILHKPMAEMIQVIDNNKKEVESVQAEIDSIHVNIRKETQVKRF